MKCENCVRLELEKNALAVQIEEMEDGTRLWEIACEYADLLAEQGRIPNTPAGKKGWINGEIIATYQKSRARAR